MKTFLVFSLFIFFSNAFANEQLILKVTNNLMNIPACVYVHLNEQRDIQRFQVKECGQNPGRINQIISASQIENGFHYRFGGKTLLKVDSRYFSKYQGGSLQVSAIRNIFSFRPSYFSMNLDLFLDQEKWQLRQKGRLITHVHCNVSRVRILRTPKGVRHCSIVGH